MNLEKLFIKISIIQISLVSFAFIFITEFILRKYIIPYDSNVRRSYIFKKSNSKNTIWGDSQSLNSINYLGNYMNFSSGSNNYQEMEKKLKNYYSRVKGNRSIVFNLSLNGLSPYRDRPINKGELKLFLSKNKKTILYLSNSYFQKRSYSYLRNFINNGFKIKPLPYYEFNEDGSESNFGYYSPPVIIKKDPNHIYTPKKDLLNDKNYKALVRIINYLNQNNIKTCFITSPWAKRFREEKIDMSKFNEINSVYKELSEKNKIPYKNFTNIELNEKYFFDETHLNNQGSKIFTKLVKDFCKISSTDKEIATNTNSKELLFSNF